MRKRAETYRCELEAYTTDTRVPMPRHSLKLIDTCLRYALTEQDPGIKQWLLWHIAHVLVVIEYEVDAEAGSEGNAGLDVDFGAVPAASHPIWRAFTELFAAQPRAFIIREEEHPLKPGRSIFRVYTDTMQPLYIGRETVEEAKMALRERASVSSLTVLYRETFPEAE